MLIKVDMTSFVGSTDRWPRIHVQILYYVIKRSQSIKLLYVWISSMGR